VVTLVAIGASGTVSFAVSDFRRTRRQTQHDPGVADAQRRCGRRHCLGDGDGCERVRFGLVRALAPECAAGVGEDAGDRNRRAAPDDLELGAAVALDSADAPAVLQAKARVTAVAAIPTEIRCVSSSSFAMAQAR